MRTSPRRHAVLGLFTAGALGIFAAGIFALGDLTAMLQDTTRVTTTFTSVDGLGRGDAVWFSGVPVGTVRGVELGTRGVEVTMEIESDAAALIPRDAVASIGSDGLIGNSLVVLDGGGRQVGLPEGAELDSQQSAGMQELLAGLTQTNDNLLTITESVKRVTSDLEEGRGTVGRLLGEEQLYEELTATTRSLRTSAGRAEQITTDLAGLSRSMNQPDSLVHDVANDKQTWKDVQDAVANLDAASEEARSLAEELDGVLDDPTTPIGVLTQSQDAGADLDTTLENLATGSQKLDENLEAMQHNFLLRGFFKKKEKRERKAREEALIADPPAPFVKPPKRTDP